MRVSALSYVPVKDTIFVDLSWLIYRNLYAMAGLSVQLSDGTIIPTGHLHGTLMDIGQLSCLAPRVILAVDSPSDRFQFYPEYKGNRSKTEKDGTPKFNPRIHTNLILAVASLLPNVFFVKKTGFEADDLINHVTFLRDDPIIYGSDNDLMQLPRPFRVARNIAGNQLEFLDLPAYIENKYKIKGLAHLPIWYKTVRGDSSDNLPPGALRYPSKLLTTVCNDLKDTFDWKDFERYIEEKKDLKLKEHLATLFRNYMVVRPRSLHLEDGAMDCKKLMDFDVRTPLLNFQLMAVITYYSTVLGVSLVG